MLTVADGVGSAPGAELGAQLAVRLIGERLAKHRPVVPRDIMRALRAGRAVWWRELAGHSVTPSASKVTFAFAVVAPPRVALGAIGDCFAFVTRLAAADGEEAHLVLDQGRRPGQYANEVGATLDSHDWQVHVRYCVLVDPSINGVALSSDGLEAVALREGIAEVGGVKQVQQVQVRRNFTDWLLARARRSDPPEAIAQDLARWDELMTITDDDLGVALAVW